MKFFSAHLQDLRELYLNDLQKALDMEEHIVKALPTMIEKATNPQLKQAFETHLDESRNHCSKVDRLLQAYGKDEPIACKVIVALIAEAQAGIKDAGDAAVRDATLIAAAQQVEHHEIAVYGTLRTWASLLGETEQVQVLDSILAQEKHADSLLSEIGNRVNSTAESAVYAAT